METCTECHAGIEFDDDLVRTWVVVMPWCFHKHAASDAMDTVMRLPGVGPVFFLPFSEMEIADRTEPAEVPERLPNFLDRLQRDVGRIEEGPDHDWPGRVDGKIVTVGVLGERLLDGDTLIEAVGGKKLRHGL